MGLSDIIALLGGVALFLFGMTLMGDGLKKVAGSKMELILYRLSGTPLRALFLGLIVTAVIQSSSATSVMVVGFVNSGMMSFLQAISIIEGAIVGTSVTGWIVCLSSIEGSGWVSLLSTSTISAVVAVIGIIFRMFSKNKTKQHVGDIMLGFAVLMFGMQSMSSAVAPLKQSESFIRLLTGFSNPILGILAGTAFTAILQSASAACGILQALSMTGAVPFSVTLPILLGVAIGASVPVLLSSVGAKNEGAKTAFSYLMVDTLGVIICGSVFYGANAIFHFAIMDMIMTPVSIALLNTVFRLITAMVLSPFNPMLEKLANLILKPKKAEAEANSVFDKLDERFLVHPALAVEQSHLTILSMAETAKKNINEAITLLNSYTPELMQSVVDTEDLVDRYEDQVGTYLMKITALELTDQQNEEVSKYLHTLTDFERISDHALNLGEIAQKMNEKQLSFSTEAQKELKVLYTAVNYVLNLAFGAFSTGDLRKAVLVEPLEERIDNLCDEMKLRHIERLKRGACTYDHSFAFNDILTNLERVSDHCSNIAVAMIELNSDEFDTHRYITDIKDSHNADFAEAYEEFNNQFKI